MKVKGLRQKIIWKAIKPFLSDKNTIFLQFSLENNNKITSDNFDLSEELTTFFEGVVRWLIVNSDGYYQRDSESLSDSGEAAIFKSNPSILAINQNIS